MKYTVAPSFVTKLQAIGSADIESVSNFLKYVQNASLEQLQQSDQFPCSLLEADILVFSIGYEIRLFASLDKSAGDLLVLLDLTVERTRIATGQTVVIHDPHRDISLNPASNVAINPKFNAQINPKYNPQINPKYNLQINPKYNTQIDPTFNSQINPRFNSQINPNFNASLNPRFNSSINPRFNCTFSGPYLYSINLKREGYIVRANEKVSLVFDMTGQFVAFLILADNSIQILFDTDNKWIGYWLNTGSHVYLRFSLDDEWSGIAV